MLTKQLEVFEKLTGGTLGVNAFHTESQQSIHFNSDKPFFMCSTVKLPIAIYLLQQVQKNELQLDAICHISQQDLRPGMYTLLNQLDYSTPVQFSVLNLLRLMLQDSDNTAADILLRLVGGPEIVMDFLKKENISNMYSNRYMIEIMADWDGIKQLPKDLKCTLDEYKILEKAVSDNDREIARQEFKTSLKDTATPQAMIELLKHVYNQSLLDSKMTEVLMNIMRRCRRGADRLMGLLPKGTPVAHKTGTLTGYTHDVGIITLPHNRGHLLIAVYIKNSAKDVTQDERVIAEVGRTLYDYFLLFS